MFSPQSDNPLTARLAIAYLLLQGALIVAFWIALLALPALRQAFARPGSPWELFLTFALPDLLLLVTTSWIGAWALVSQSRWTIPILWLNAGAAGYAALCAVALFLSDRHLWLGAVMMSPLLVIPGLIAATRSGPAR